jgi:hypothetical protein
MATLTPCGRQAAADLRVSYRMRDGRERIVLVGLDANGVWLVYDVLRHDRRARRGLLVERLLGDQEKVGEARALAVEYAACQTAFVQGRREEHPSRDPLPRAIRVPLWLIVRHIRLAARAVNAAERDLVAGAAWFERVTRLAEQQQHPKEDGPATTVAA